MREPTPTARTPASSDDTMPTMVPGDLGNSQVIL